MTYSHHRPNPNDLSALDELAVLDALAVGLTVALIRAGDRKLRLDYLARFETFVRNRRDGLSQGLQGAGLIYADVNHGEGRVWVLATPFRAEEAA